MGKRSNESLEVLPETGDLPDLKISSDLYGTRMTVRQEAQKLLAEAHQLREAEGRLKSIKARLAEIIREEGLDGLRHGMLCCIPRYQAGRRSLDRGLLIDNGVTPEQIEMSMRQGEPITVVELPEMEG